MADALEIGLTALRAHQRAMEVTGHNIANAATPGYSRQRVELATPMPESIRPGMLGRGVDLVAVRRESDDLLIERLRQTQTDSGRLNGLSSTLSAIEAAFDEPGENGFSGAINRFYAAFEDLANNPESPALRSAVATEMQTFPRRLNDLAAQMDALRQDLRDTLPIQLEKVNAIAAQIADLNQRVSAETLAGNNPNDLLDRRETLLNELSQYFDLRVSVDPRDGVARVDLGGRLLVSFDRATPLVASRDGQGFLAVTFADGVRAGVDGGAIGALLELDGTLLPSYQERLDDVARAIIAGFNAVHSTGTSSDFRGERFISENIVESADRALNLDDPAQVKNGLAGIPETFLPDFTDASGVSQARNLTINVLDTATGVATKHVVRYEPGTGPIPASRSLDDLVAAINSGRGGGFSLHPPSAGIAGMKASVIAVDGGLKFALDADSGKSIDFSQALDVRPAAAAWTGPDVTVSGGNAALANRRLEFMVQNGGTELALGYRDALTKVFVPYPAAGGNTVPLPAGGTIGGITVAPAAGAYLDGESFTVDLDATGAIAGSVTTTSAWTAGSATATFSGRYTGGLAFDPSRPWTMRVLSSGVVGAAANAAPPNNPPVVEFTYWSSDVGGVVSRTVTKSLDSTVPAGTPVAIADGVYASFGAGSLTSGDQVSVLVDGQPDQAGILPALGINGLFQGNDARTLAVVDRLRQDPNQFAIAQTRTAGDNSNVLALIATRDQRRLGNGQLTIEGAYQSTVSEIGVRVDQNRRLSETQELVRSTLENRRSDTSGVSIDQEVGDLIMEQQAYAAAARLITTARENISTLLDLIG